MSSSLSPIFYLFLIPSGKLYQKVQCLLAEDEHLKKPSSSFSSIGVQGQSASTYGIPASEWPTVVQRVVEQKESLRTVAAAFGVSHETIRRIVLHVQKQHEQ